MCCNNKKGCSAIEKTILAYETVFLKCELLLLNNMGFCLKKKIKKNLFKDFQAGGVPGKASGRWREKGVFTLLIKRCLTGCMYL